MKRALAGRLKATHSRGRRRKETQISSVIRPQSEFWWSETFRNVLRLPLDAQTSNSNQAQVFSAVSRVSKPACSTKVCPADLEVGPSSGDPNHNIWCIVSRNHPNFPCGS